MHNSENGLTSAQQQELRATRWRYLDLGWINEEQQQKHLRWDPIKNRNVRYSPGRLTYRTDGREINDPGWDKDSRPGEACLFCEPELSACNDVVNAKREYLVISNKHSYLIHPERAYVVVWPRWRHCETISETQTHEMVIPTEWVLRELRSGRAQGGFHNYGIQGGGSQPHLHWQVLTLGQISDPVQQEMAMMEPDGGLFHEIRQYEQIVKRRIVAETEHWIGWVPWWNDNEILITPAKGSRFEEGVLGKALHHTVSLYEQQGAASGSWWIHTYPYVGRVGETTSFIEHVHYRLTNQLQGSAEAGYNVAVARDYPYQKAERFREAGRLLKET